MYGCDDSASYTSDQSCKWCEKGPCLKEDAATNTYSSSDDGYKSAVQTDCDDTNGTPSQMHEGHRHKKKKSRRKEVTQNKTERSRSSSSLFHRQCTPEEPRREFMATPIPAGLLRHQSPTNARSRSLSPKRLKGILKKPNTSAAAAAAAPAAVDRQGAHNRSQSSNGYGRCPYPNCLTCAYSSSHRNGPMVANSPGAHCHTANNQWRRNTVQLTNVTNKSTGKRVPIELRSKQTKTRRDCYHSHTISPPQTSKVRPKSLVPSATVGSMAHQRNTSSNRAASSCKGDSSTSKASKDMCRLCHCYDCYSQYQQYKDNKAREDVAKPRPSNDPAVPWTDDWFHQMVEFRQKCFWECHAERTKYEEQQKH